MKADCKGTDRLIERLEAYRDALAADQRMSSASIAALMTETIDALEAMQKENHHLKKRIKLIYTSSNGDLYKRIEQLEAMVTALKKEMLEAESQTCSTIFGKPYSEWKDMEARVAQLEAAICDADEAVGLGEGVSLEYYMRYMDYDDSIRVIQQAIGEKECKQS